MEMRFAITQRQSVLGLLIIQTVGAVLLLLAELIQSSSWVQLLTIGVVTVIYAGLLFAYWSGYEWVRYVDAVLLTISAGFAIAEPYVTGEFSIALLVVPALVLILAGPSWVIGSAITLLVVLVARAGGQGPYLEPANLAIYSTGIGALILGRMVTATAQRAAETSAAAAETARKEAESRAREIEFASHELELRFEEQRQLVDLVTTLETPAVRLADGVLLAPLIGGIDSRRAETLTQRLLNDIASQRTHTLLLDLSGVAMVDTAVARAITNMIGAVQLLGVSVTISGITAPVAQTMSQLGIFFENVTFVRSPQEAIEIIAGSNSSLTPASIRVAHNGHALV